MIKIELNHFIIIRFFSKDLHFIMKMSSLPEFICIFSDITCRTFFCKIGPYDF